MSTKKMLHRSLALLLALVMTLGLVPQQALAYLAERPEELTIVDKDGNTVAVTEDWETAFPYGTFAFSDFQMVAEEGGNTAVIKVYRLGGTQGRAVAYVTYEPALTQLEDGSASYSTAAGSNDIIIEVENPLPGAENQPIGQPEQPEEPKKAVSVEQSQAEDGVLLSIDVEAEAYQWYVLYADGWELISNATGREMLVGEEELAEYDFRCVYTVDGVAYGSDSLLGVPYEAEPRRRQPERKRRPEPVSRPVPQERRKSIRIGLPTVVMLFLALAAVIYISYGYLYLSASVDDHMDQVEVLEKQLENLRTENDALEQSIDTSIDLSYVYDVAINKLGMVHAGENNTIKYQKTESEYVRQYESITEH